MSPIAWLELDDDFPPASDALSEPNGLLAAGADLSAERLIHAYKSGIFPWYSDDQPILWWSPNPRCVVFPEHIHVSKSLKKHIRKHRPQLTFNQAFDQVIHYCSRPTTEEGTWITDEMMAAYTQLHHMGVAHSVEVWQNDNLIGGLYGLAIGKCFFGESMFSLASNASKVALTGLTKQLKQWGYKLIDCQVESPHLLSMGANCIPRHEFLAILERYVNQPCQHPWQFETTLLYD